MACPYFRPLARMAPERWRNPPRLPLIDAFDGVCEAAPETWIPDEATLKEYCSFGYARGHCGRFPADSLFDAVRFTMRGVSDVSCTLEREYAPAKQEGIDALSGRFAAQADVFASGWRRRPKKENQP